MICSTFIYLMESDFMYNIQQLSDRQQDLVVFQKQVQFLFLTIEKRCPHE